MLVYVRVLKAHLSRNFDFLPGVKMDPFAELEWKSGSGEPICMGQTETAWKGHMDPKWANGRGNMFRGQAYSGTDQLTLRVKERNIHLGMESKPTFCGEVVVDVSTMLAGARPVHDDSGDMVRTPEIDLEIIKNGETTGTITIQLDRCELQAQTPGALPSDYKKVDAALFKTPVQRLKVSGGTAPFFSLELHNPDEARPVGYWIGKDLSRAQDEVDFYEEVLHYKGHAHGLERLFSFMMEYKGILACQEADLEPDAARKPLQLLVLENLREGRENLRMLDIKIGEKTAAPGWKGKSSFAATRQDYIDSCTNSKAEGFRLEGFDGQPPVVNSFDPVLDFNRLGLLFSTTKADSTEKVLRRFALQRMPGSDVFMHFLDVHQQPRKNASSPEDALRPSEFAELISWEVSMQLCRLALACCTAPVAQKWLGSSVALGFDDARLPRRSLSREQLQKRVLVKIFDWGRSELDTYEKHSSLEMQEQSNRHKFWDYYCEGIYRLAWESARTYHHWFWNRIGWTSVVLKVYDFDSCTENDLLGMVRVSLEPTEAVEVGLKDEKGKDVIGKDGQKATLTYSVIFCALPEDSCLHALWRVHVAKASHLPAADTHLRGEDSSDPFVVLVAESEDGAHKLCQQTSVIQQKLNPVWDETLELPVARRHAPDLLDKMLGEAAKGILAKDIFPAPHVGLAAASALVRGRSSTSLAVESLASDCKAFLTWKKCLRAAGSSKRG